MTHINPRPTAINHNRKGCEGFTMVEVVIAGAILVATMTAVAQMGVSALAGSKNLSQRAGIEGAVNNDIQLLQQADSYLSYQSINDEEKEKACENPTAHLIDHLKEEVNASTLSKRQIERTMKTGATEDVVEITYKFQGPETGVSTEYRIVELNPNFSAECYTTS